ncbi:MAG: MFS transporter [Sphingomonas fennica]
MMSAPPPARVAGRPQGFVLVLPSTLTVMGGIILAPVLPDLMAAFGHVPDHIFWVPALLAVPGLIAGLLSPLAGFAGDRWGRRTLLIAATLAYAVVGLLPLVLTDFAAIFVARMALGLTEAFILVLSTALIGDYFSGRDRNRWLSGQTITATAAALVLLPVGGLLGSALGWRGPFLAYGLALPLAVALWRLTWDMRSHGDAGVPAPWSALPWAWLLRLCAISIFGSILFYAVQFQIGLGLSAIGLVDSGRIGIFSAVATLGVPVGALCFWRVSDQPFARLLAAELLLAGVTLVGLGQVHAIGPFVALAFLNLVACGLLLPTLLTTAARGLDAGVRGRGIGIWQACFSIGQFASVAVTAGVRIAWPGTSVLAAFSLLGWIALAVAAASLFVAVRGGGAPFIASTKPRFQ